ncbi:MULTISPECIES: 30S ribosomal protein THX [Olivibacter]|jgi:30S ribosomal protein S31|uniref:30S ribosomal protein THX n=1 Tax=Olivibacter jilunii TaxID=985016 RepID=A0ABW6B8D4_9SPHI|nr:30S ribosomal protein THX [Olivibacter jilunii]MDX3915794.1 30S ribosomal protein THX [Pseudosphingobacterium sp.]
MGKGDKKTKRGKITMGSFGKTRPHKQKKIAAATAVVEEKATVSAKNKKG